MVRILCREKTIGINEYEKFLGAEGKYKTNFGTYNDIFPDKIPKRALVEQFCDGFTDFDYLSVIDEKYLPEGFDISSAYNFKP
ncbi:MAG: hypothetical protein ACI4ES_08080 [Roseburia sp.]